MRRKGETEMTRSRSILYDAIPPARFKLGEVVNARRWIRSCKKFPLLQKVYKKLTPPVKVTHLRKSVCQSGWMIEITDSFGNSNEVDMDWLKPVREK